MKLVPAGKLEEVKAMYTSIQSLHIYSLLKKVSKNTARLVSAPRPQTGFILMEPTWHRQTPITGSNSSLSLEAGKNKTVNSKKVELIYNRKNIQCIYA